MRMAAGSIGSSFASLSAMAVSAGKEKKRSAGVCCATANGTGNLMEQYRVLGIQPGASEKDVKSAFRQLALQYHPDVCKGSNCGVQFHRINEAYDIVISNLRAPKEQQHGECQTRDWCSDDGDEQFRGMYDSSWDLWEEWMGWEGAGIRDYSSHINPYI